MKIKTSQDINKIYILWYNERHRWFRLIQLGLKDFFTYHFTEGSTFRPCATSDNAEKAMSAAIIESQELRMIGENNFSEVFFGGSGFGNFVLPIHLHPLAKKRFTSNVVLWYSAINETLF